MRNRKKWMVAAIVAVILGVWMYARWDVWFSIPDEPPYRPLPAPGRLMLTFGDGTEWSRNVSWQCGDSVQPSFVELCEQTGSLWSEPVVVKADGEVFVSRSGRAAYYVARLRRLRPATRYRYRVCTGSQYTSWYAFETVARPCHHTAFVYVGDVQDTIGGETNRLLRDVFRRHADAQFLVCGGDLTERPSDNYWAESFRTLDGIRQSVPVLCATGNHDYLKTLPLRLERRFSLVFSYFLDSMADENQVYVQSAGNADLFLLDSNREFNYLWAQRQWLAGQLRQSQARWKILVVHHPLFSIKGSTQNIVQRWMFNDLAEEFGVDLVLQGHEHAYARMTRHADGRPVTPVYTVSHCSPKNYRIQFDDRFDKFGISNRFYQTVRISGDTLQLAAYEVNGGTLYDSLAIIKHGDGVPTIVDLGRTIPECMDYTPDPKNKKDMKYAERISEYCELHPERLAR